VSVYLLDLNVLVALAWPAHSAHSLVQNWMSQHARHGWATCPFTQTAFVRILSNPAFSQDALTPANALSLLAANLEHPTHRFWEDDISFPKALELAAARIVGRQQVTDAYLLGLAIHRKGKLATLDRGIVSLLREGEQERCVFIE
jgi:toxin-antitoxin system PIN domain toxin